MGLLALLLRGLLPLDAFSAWSERIVGVTLVVIGLWGLRSALRTRIHAHVHDHGDGRPHAHVHVHEAGTGASHDHAGAHSHTHTHTRAPLFVGLLHGVSGGSHLLGILPALALPDVLSALLYLTGFGGASVAGMTAFAWTVGRVTRTAGRRIAAAGPAMLALCSAAAVVIGGFWIFMSV
jgi:ABC-type nickel/cobalt efflux system permease component RcnA